MKHALFLILLSIATNTVHAQDLITKTNGSDIKAKVLEVTQTEIKYKRYESPQGPIYTISKSDALMIRYKDGTKDIFKNDENVKPKVSSIVEAPLEKAPKVEVRPLTDYSTRGAKVFVSSDDNASVVHCKSAFKKWGYWQIVDNVEDADIIANVIITQKALAFESIIVITNPISKKILLKTEMALAYASEHINPKKAAIERAVDKKLVPLIKAKTTTNL